LWNFAPKAGFAGQAVKGVRAMANPQSTAKIGGHPIHPMIVPFPIAFFSTALLCDLVYWGSSNTTWSTASIWLIGAGIVMALLAALGGFTDFLGDQRIRDLSAVWWHFIGNLVLVVIEVGNWFLRYDGGAVLPWGLVLSFIAVGLMLITGWKGWEMVYLHRVAIADTIEPFSAPRSTPSADHRGRAA
jgi:uncharacterized membrane protein